MHWTKVIFFEQKNGDSLVVADRGPVGENDQRKGKRER